MKAQVVANVLRYSPHKNYSTVFCVTFSSLEPFMRCGLNSSAIKAKICPNVGNYETIFVNTASGDEDVIQSGPAVFHIEFNTIPCIKFLRMANTEDEVRERIRMSMTADERLTKLETMMKRLSSVLNEGDSDSY